MAETSPKQRKRIGGRGKGSLNKRTIALADQVQAKLSKMGFDPVRRSVALYNAVGTPIEQKVRILVELMSYIYPKKRAIEHSGTLFDGLAEAVRLQQEARSKVEAYIEAVKGETKPPPPSPPFVTETQHDDSTEHSYN